MSAQAYRCRNDGYTAGAMNQAVKPSQHQADRLFRLPARLPVDLRARSRADRRAHHRPRARRQGQRLHRRRDLRQGCALCRARASQGPAAASVAAHRRQRRRPIPENLLGRRARSGRRKVSASRAAPRRRSRVALLLRRHHGPGDARRHQLPAPRQEIFRLPLLDLRQSGLCRLCRRHRHHCRRRSARNGEIRSGGDLGHQRGQHPGQCDDARDPRAQRARRQDRGGRHLHERHHGSRPICRCW